VVLRKGTLSRSGTGLVLHESDLVRRWFSLLTQNNEDVKVVQGLLRHANSRITLDLYAQAGMAGKHEAQRKVVEMVLPVQALRAAKPDKAPIAERVASSRSFPGNHHFCPAMGWRGAIMTPASAFGQDGKIFNARGRSGP